MEKWITPFSAHKIIIPELLRLMLYIVHNIENETLPNLGCRADDAVVLPKVFQCPLLSTH